MKKLILTILMLVPAVAYAQEPELSDAQKAALEAAEAINEVKAPEPEKEKPNYWKTSYGFDLGFNQTALLNWAAGGYNTLSLAAGTDISANFAKELTSWDNRIQLDYGFLWSADKKNLLQKSKDRIYLESKFAYKTGEKSKWRYTASLNFRSQFSNSFDNYQQEDKDDPNSPWFGKLKSGFLAPAYTDIALGLEWKPTEWFNVNIAPITGGITAVRNPELRKDYGMKLKDETLDPATATGDDYRSCLFQFGAQIKLNLKVNINDNFKYETQAVFFTDYLNKPFVHNRINWDNSISWTPAKFFKVGLATWLIYDPLVTITDKNGVARTSLVQFKEFLSLNLTYTLKPDKKNK